MSTWKNQIWYILFIIAFTAVSFYAVQNRTITNTEREEAQAEQARQSLESIQKIWELSIFSQVNSWFAYIEDTDNIEQLEVRLRSERDWFDAIYIWNPNVRPAEDSSSIIYPNQLGQEIMHRCIQSPILISDCSDYPENIQNRLALLQAKALIQKGKNESAQERVQQFPPLTTSLSELNFTPREILDFLKRRNVIYKTESLGGPRLNGQLLLKESIQELQNFSAPLIKAYLEDLPSVPNISDGETQESLQRLRRRVRAYDEIEDLSLSGMKPEQLQIRSDPYGDKPYLMLYKRGRGDQMIAVSLDPARLLDTLFSTPENTSQIRPMIVNAEGHPLLRQAGGFSPSEELWVQVPGGVLFPHLRLAYIRTIAHNQILPNLLPQLIPIAIAGALGLFALFGSFRADRRQREFVARQQAFIARVTHEFKTPLAGIKLMAESLQMGVLKDPSQSEIFVEKILMETDRLEQRIDEVLQVARRPELMKMELIDSEILLMELYETWHPRFLEVKGVLRFEQDSTDFFGDIELIRDAIDNLLSNAIKYRNPNRNLRTILEIQGRGNWIEISVSDNGIGVPILERKRIFERFVRIETDNRGFSGGHGLGLAFVSETAEAHKGTVKCSDGINGGTKFSFRIPKNQI